MMNRRRRVVALVFAVAGIVRPLAALGQAAKRYRVGILWAGDESSARPQAEAFLEGLHERGYVAGRNLVVDMRHADGDMARLGALSDELIALKPDVLVGIQAPAIAMKAKTATIPIVLLAAPNPVAAGLVHSLARPGTNVTGLSYRQDELVAKHIEFLAEIVPGMARIGLLNYAALPGDPVAGVAARYAEAAEAAAAAAGLWLVIAAVRDPASVEAAFAEFARAGVQGVVVVTTGPTFMLREQIISNARRLRLPTVTHLPPTWSESGGLLNYGPDFLKNYRYAAGFVDRILKGANPAEMPIEQPPQFQFVVNLRAAREIGVTVPPSILLRADRVID